MANQFSILKDVIVHPLKAFVEISKKPKKFILGGVSIALILPFLLSLFYSTSQIAVLYTAVSAVVSWIIVIASLHYLGKWIFKGKASLTAMISSVSYAYFPNLLGAILSIPFFLMAGDKIMQIAKMQGASPEAILPVTQQLVTPGIITLLVIMIVLFIWTIVLTVIACMKAHKINLWKSIVVYLIYIVILIFVAIYVLMPLNNLIGVTL